MTSTKRGLWIPPQGIKEAALSVLFAPFNPELVLMNIHRN